MSDRQRILVTGPLHDRDGDYVRRWVPELATLPAKTIHDPTPAQRCELGYVDPIGVEALSR